MVLKNRVNSWSALFEFYSWILVLTWSIIIASMLVFGLYQIRQVQREIVQTEKLSSLGSLVSGVAHEINNPNNFISFNIPILKEYLNKILPIIDDYAENHENF